MDIGWYTHPLLQCWTTGCHSQASHGMQAMKWRWLPNKEVNPQVNSERPGLDT